MNLFGIGSLELLLVLIVALVALGPKRLPEMAGRLGVILHQARQQVAEARQTIVTDLKAIDSLSKDGIEPDRSAVKGDSVGLEKSTSALASVDGEAEAATDADSPAELSKESAS